MKNQSAIEYSVQVKIIKDYMVVTSLDFPEIQISAGNLTANLSSSEGVSAISIGRAVLKGFARLKEKMAEIERLRGRTEDASNFTSVPLRRQITSPTRFLSIGEVARLLGVSPSSIRRMISQGVLRSELTSGGHRRFDERQVVEVLRNRKRGELNP